MNAIAYIRCSTDEQADSHAGLDAQLAAIQQHCTKNGLTLCSVHSDPGVSGAAGLEARPALLEAIAAITKDSVLIVAKRDRLARDPIVSASIERLISKKRGRILSAAGEGTSDDEPSSVLMRRMVDAFAEHERLIGKARTKAALKAKRVRGERAGRIPYGFQLAPASASTARSKKNGNPIAIEGIPAQLAIVARIKSQRAAGATLRSIADQLTSDGIPTATGNAVWKHSTIARIIKGFHALADATASVLIDTQTTMAEHTQTVCVA